MILCCNYQPKKLLLKTETGKNGIVSNFPFLPKYSRTCQNAADSNVGVVLNCLKKYIDGDIPGSTAYFADTAEFISDSFYFRGSRDSLAGILSAMRRLSVKVSKNFESWISTDNPEGPGSRVTLWYTEIMTDRTGNVDSVYYTDDVIIQNSKIVRYDEKQRRFPR